MTPEEYLLEVRRTMSPETTATTLQLGLLGESGEVADLVKKATAHGHTLDREKLVKELGDVLWYAVAKIDSIRGLGVFNVFHSLGNLLKPSATPAGANVEASLAIDLCSAAALLGKCSYPFEAKAPAEHVLQLLARIGGCFAEPVTLEEIMTKNVEKLRARYPDGFSTEASQRKADEWPNEWTDPNVCATKGFV